MAELRSALIDPSIFTPPYDQALAESLRETGVEVEWLGRAPRPDDAVNPDKIQPRQFFYRRSEAVLGRIPGSAWLALKFVEHVLNCRRLLPFLQASRTDVAHFQWTPVPFVDQRVIRRLREHLPVILTVHDTEVFHGNASHSFQRMAWDKVLRGCDRLIVHVESAIEPLLKLGVAEERIVRIAHPAFDGPGAAEIDAACQSFPERLLGFDGSRTNFLLFGRLAPYKGLDTVLQALAGMSGEQREKLRVVIAGKPAFDVDAYRADIDRHGLNSVIELRPKFLERAELIAYLRQTDAILFPYLDIDASGALMEALAYRPVLIASRIGMFREILTHDENALLVEPGDTQTLRHAMLRVAGDPVLRSDFANAVGGLLQGELGWSHAAAKTHEVYLDALESRG